MGLHFTGHFFRGKSGRSRQVEIEKFIKSMDLDCRVRQFAYDETPEFLATECTVIKGWHETPEAHSISHAD